MNTATSEQIDRASCRAMVEDHWRVFLSAGSPDAGERAIHRFMQRIRSIAYSMPESQAATFLDTIEEERDLLFQEYQRSPDALKARLGLRPTPQPAGRQRQGLGETAVKTAVRATVWQGIRELFRLFR